MELILLVLAVLSGFIRFDVVHFLALLAHMIGGVFIAWKLMRTQPITAIAVMTYIGLYFVNPMAIMLGLIPLESETPWHIYYMANAYLMVGFDLFIFAARRFRTTSHNLNRMPHLKLPMRAVDIVIMAGLIVSMLMLALLIMKVGSMGANIFKVEKAFRVSSGEHNVYFILASNALSVLPMIAFLIALNRWPRQVFYLSLLILILIVHFMIWRIRGLPIAVSVGYMVGLATKHFFVSLDRRYSLGRVPAILKVSLILGLPLLVLMGVTIKYVRGSYERQDYAITEDRLEYLQEATLTGGDLGYAYFTRRAIDLFPESAPYLYGQSYYRILFLPIPRYIWPEKPTSTNHIFSQLVNPDHHHDFQSIPPGLVGDLYVNFGPPGVLGMLFFGWLFAQERYYGLKSLLFLSASGLWVFYLMRGTTTTPLVRIMAILVIAYVITRVIHPMFIHRVQPTTLPSTAPTQV